VTARCLHPWPGNTLEYSIWHPFANGLYQSGSKIVAGCLAGNDTYLERM
jgi:hypothetical protein